MHTAVGNRRNCTREESLFIGNNYGICLGRNDTHTPPEQMQRSSREGRAATTQITICHAARKEREKEQANKHTVRVNLMPTT